MKHNMGRPKNLYSLTAKAEDYFPKKYHQLAEELIEELAREGDDRLRRAIRNISTRLAAPYKNEVVGKSTVERMIILQRALEENGGDIVVRKEKGTFSLFNYNCPLNALSSKHPELCDIHHNLIRSIVGIEVTREKCMARNDEYCQFTIG
jgi:predicted ArsR family transcriptional regulator